MVLVTQFLEEHKDTIGNAKAFAAIRRDLADYMTQSGDAIAANNFTAKLILSHHYDGYTDARIAKAFKEFALRNTEFVDGSYDEAR